MLASIAIRTAIVSLDRDINALSEVTGIDSDAIAYFLTDQHELDALELEALKRALWGVDVEIAHGRVRPVTAP